MFGSQAMRLLRSSWTGLFGAKGLSRELFAMFQDDIPLTQNAPLTLNQTGNGPALDLRRKPGADGPLVQFGNRQTTYPGINIQAPDDSGFDVRPDGGFVLSGPYINITVIENGQPTEKKLGGDGSTAPPIKVETSGGGGGVPGFVVSGGPGDTYAVTIYPDGLSQPSQDVTAKQLSIDAAETIPAGTWTLVTKTSYTDNSGTHVSYYMQVPVWL